MTSDARVGQKPPAGTPWRPANTSALRGFELEESYIDAEFVDIDAEFVAVHW